MFEVLLGLGVLFSLMTEGRVLERKYDPMVFPHRLVEESHQVPLSHPLLQERWSHSMDVRADRINCRIP